MAIQLLGGKARGFSCEIPKGDEVRPLQVLLKRRIFDSYQNFEGVHFVDLCAGTGAVGLEVLSRGGDKINFVEKSHKVFTVLSKNIERFCSNYQGMDKIELSNQSCTTWIKKFKDLYENSTQEQKENTVLFFAPPYPMHELYQKFIPIVFCGDWFKGVLWVESDDHKGPTQSELEKLGVREDKLIRQGSSFVMMTSF
jgi:16S rRNA (guanine966-N2)-methyltransferase